MAARGPAALLKSADMVVILCSCRCFKKTHAQLLGTKQSTGRKKLHERFLLPLICVAFLEHVRLLCCGVVLFPDVGAGRKDSLQFFS